MGFPHLDLVVSFSKGVKTLKHLVQITHGQHHFCIVFVSLLNEDVRGSFSQGVSVFIREGSIASFDKVMIEGGVGVPWRTYGHLGEVQVVDWVGGDRGGDGILLPLLVRLSYQDPSSDEPKADY